MDSRASLLGIAIGSCLLAACATRAPAPPPAGPAAPAALAAGVLRDEGTGLVFPAAIGAWQRARVIRYRELGLGLAVGYRVAVPRVILTAYVYDKSLSGIPQQVRSPAVAAEFKASVREIYDIAQQAQRTDIRMLSAGVIRLAGPGSREALQAAFAYYDAGQPVLSRLILTTFRNHFLKLRISHGPHQAAEAERLIVEMLAYFDRAIGQQLADAGDQRRSPGLRMASARRAGPLVSSR